MEIVLLLLEHDDLELIRVIPSSVRGYAFACYTKSRTDLGERVSLGQTRLDAMKQRAVEFTNDHGGFSPEDDI
jgi:hypothetical protein